MSEQDADAIVVGAGPAGVACAYRLARAGRSVILVERGTAPGSKNVSGGRLYTYALELVEEGLTAQAPWERAVVREQLVLMDGERAMTVSLAGSDAGRTGVPSSVTVLRASFDDWFARRAEDAGALLAAGVTVDSLLVEDGRVVGIVADGEQMRAPVVVAADGVTSGLARQAGLVGPPSSRTVGVGAKRVIELEPAVIEERFGVGPRDGVATLMVGCTGGVHGGGFLYTNRASLSLGVVAAPADLAPAGRTIHGLLAELAEHPSIAPLVAGGEIVEYSAHLVREDGLGGVPRRLTRDGFLVTGEAAGFVLNLGYTVRGMDLALASGVAAAHAVLTGRDLETAYRSALATVLATMRATDGYRDLLHLDRLYATYPRMALETVGSLFTVDGSVPRSVRRQLRDATRSCGVPVRSLLHDGLVAVRSA